MEALARLKAEGALVPKDMPSAIDLARRGADLGHRGARTYLESLLSASESGAKPSNNS